MIVDDLNEEMVSFIQMTNNHPNNRPPFSSKKLGKGLQGRVIVLQKLDRGSQVNAVAWQGGSCAHALKVSPADAMQTYSRHHAGEVGGKRKAFFDRRVPNRQQGAKVFGEAGSGPS